MEILLKLYGPSRLLNDQELLLINLPKDSKVGELRDILSKLILKKKLESNLKNLPDTAAFFSNKNEIIDDSYKLKDKEQISIIPPIGGG